MINSVIWAFESELSNILYKPALARVLGSIPSAILLQQICYWNSKKKYKGFYKFNKPCNHPLYRVGDSWTEELAMGETVFTSARDLISTSYDNIGELMADLKAGDKTEDNQCVFRYLNKSDNRIWYYVNYPAVIKVLEKAEKTDREIQEKIKDNSEKVVDNPLMEAGWNPELPVEKISTPLYRDYTEKNISGEIKTQNTKTKPLTTSNVKSPQAKLFAERGKRLKEDYVLPDYVRKELQDAGFDEEDIGEEIQNFKYYYTQGKGRRKLHYDWSGNFQKLWMENQYKWGKVKRNGRFYKSNSGQQEVDSIREILSPDFWAEIED